MANVIGLAKAFLPMLDQVYSASAKSAILDAPDEWLRAGAKANEVLIPKIAMDGLGDYDRNTGFVAGDVDFEWVTHQFTQDRGRSFIIDAQDDEESLNLAFGMLAGEFIRTKVTPEVDAYRFAMLYSKAVTKVNADLTKDTALQAIDTAQQVLEDAGVEEASMVLFISPTMKTYLKQSNLITRQFVTNVGPLVINREVEMLDQKVIVTVPQTRFYSAITLYDGSTAGQEAGGYIKTAVTGKDLNFILMDARAGLGLKKTALPRIFDPETYQDANAWKFDYRLYHDLFVPDNKTSGVYAHSKA